LKPAPAMVAPGGAAVAALMPVPMPAAVAGGRRCATCDAPLRATARFCSACGTTQPAQAAPAAERRTFCDMCGRPVEAGTKFCMSCGEPVAERRQA
ncbi:MAG: zinc ribbon domain-containing protein, partial [Chloroflexales bacterium]|nr:zinc ribbon domain-containing protein [Chloroflexales bacterium]